MLGYYTLPPSTQGLPPTVSEALDSWRANTSGAAALLEEAPAPKKWTSGATVVQALVRAYQVGTRCLPFASHADFERKSFVRPPGLISMSITSDSAPMKS